MAAFFFELIEVGEGSGGEFGFGPSPLEIGHGGFAHGMMRLKGRERVRGGLVAKVLNEGFGGFGEKKELVRAGLDFW